MADPNLPGYLTLGALAVALHYRVIRSAVRHGFEDRDRKRARKEKV